MCQIREHTDDSHKVRGGNTEKGSSSFGGLDKKTGKMRAFGVTLAVLWPQGRPGVTAGMTRGVGWGVCPPDPRRFQGTCFSAGTRGTRKVLGPLWVFNENVQLHVWHTGSLVFSLPVSFLQCISANFLSPLQSCLLHGGEGPSLAGSGLPGRGREIRVLLLKRRREELQLPGL